MNVFEQTKCTLTQYRSYFQDLSDQEQTKRTLT